MAFETVISFNNATVEVFLNFNLYTYQVYNPDTVEKSFRINGYGNILAIPSKSYYLLTEGTYGLSSTGVTRLETTTSDISFRLERELKNTAPTQPGAFTQPTGELEIGDTRTISWGPSTEATVTNIIYSVDIQINGGAWDYVKYAGPSPSFSYTIPTATSIKFRVRAQKSDDLQSPYRESPTYTVTKPKYYWSKYNAMRTDSGTLESSVGGEWYPKMELNGTKFVVSGTPFQVTTTQNAPSGYYYMLNDATIWETGATVGDLKQKPNGNYYWQTAFYTYGTPSLIQSGLIATEGTYPINGIHTDGFWYVRGSRVNQSIAPTGTFTAPTPATVLKPSQGVAVTFTASTAANISLYELEYRYNSGLWTTLGTNNTALTRSFTPTTDKTLTNVQFRVRAKNTSNIYSDYVYSEFYNIEHNAKPTITLTTANNLVLTENTNIVIAGSATDTDNGNVLSVKYQINTGTTQAIATAISNGTTALAYSKTLQFRRGTLYDGTTAIIDNLLAGQTYTLKVWAEDDQGGKSDVQTRSFTVIPNRAPILTVNAVTSQSNKINNDTMTITGSVSDPENQNILVKYKINEGSLTQIYSGTGGNFTFNVKLGDTNDGENIIEIQATDTYDLLTTKKLKFTKTKNKVSLLKSSARYKATIPTTGITGVVAWFEKENGDLTIVPDASLRNTGETEVFAAMTKSNTAPVNGDITEDQYQLTAAAAKTAVVLRVTLTKATAASDKGIKKITGALQ